MEAEATKIRTIKVMMSAKRKKMSSSGQGGDFREGEPDKEPPLKFGSERGEGGAGGCRRANILTAGKDAITPNNPNANAPMVNGVRVGASVEAV